MAVATTGVPLPEPPESPDPPDPHLSMAISSIYVITIFVSFTFTISDLNKKVLNPDIKISLRNCRMFMLPIIASMQISTAVCRFVFIFALTGGCVLLSSRYDPCSSISSFLISTSCCSSSYEGNDGKSSYLWWFCDPPVSSSMEISLSCLGEIIFSVSNRISISQEFFPAILLFSCYGNNSQSEMATTCRNEIVSMTMTISYERMGLFSWQIEGTIVNNPIPLWNLYMLGTRWFLSSFMEFLFLPNFPLVLSGFIAENKIMLLHLRGSKVNLCLTFITRSIVLKFSEASVLNLLKSSHMRSLFQNFAPCREVPSVLVAKAHTLKAALIASINASFQTLTCFSDARSLDMLFNMNDVINESKAVLRDIQCLSIGFKSISFAFIRRLTNVFVDVLAKSGLVSLNYYSNFGA